MSGGQAAFIGLAIGLLISAVVFTVTSDVLDGTPARPQEVPADAIWMTEAFGGEHWVSCGAPEGKTTCAAFAANGSQVLEATYVPRDGQAPSPPFSDLVVRDVERVYLNKVAMVPDGTISFPHAATQFIYNDGKRLK